jgi:hypothetical protein
MPTTTIFFLPDFSLVAQRKRGPEPRKIWALRITEVCSNKEAAQILSDQAKPGYEVTPTPPYTD